MFSEKNHHVFLAERVFFSRCSKQFQVYDLQKVLFFTRTTKIYAFWSNSGKKYTLEDVAIGGSINQGTQNGLRIKNPMIWGFGGTP